MLFYPADAPLPAELRREEFVLRPLTPAHVELDYASLMVSNEMLRRWSGGSWPGDDFTLAENLEDLKMHDEEHQAGIAYTFTVLNPAETECLGCVYIDPLTRLLRQAEVDEATITAVPDYHAVVRFWVKQPRLADDLDQRLFVAPRDWFARDWAFARVYFRANERDTRQAQLLEAAGRPQLYALQVPGRNGRYLVYG